MNRRGSAKTAPARVEKVWNLSHLLKLATAAANERKIKFWNMRDLIWHVSLSRTSVKCSFLPKRVMGVDDDDKKRIMFTHCEHELSREWSLLLEAATRHLEIFLRCLVWTILFNIYCASYRICTPTHIDLGRKRGSEGAMSAVINSCLIHWRGINNIWAEINSRVIVVSFPENAIQGAE